jgi:MFS family permease
MLEAHINLMLSHFLSNRGINLLNFHIGLQSFANNFGALFIGVFLYQLGIPLWQIFLGLSSSFYIRLVLRPIALKSCFKFGLKKVLILGTLFYAINYPILGQIESLDAWFFLFFFIFAITDIFYWLPYHTIFAILGDNEKRGKQTSMRDGVYMLAEFLAPLISGVLILNYGYKLAFVSAMFFMVIAIIPILKLPKLSLKGYETKNLDTKSINKDGFWLYAGEGFMMNQEFTWNLILFLIVLNPAYFGGLVGLAVFLQFLLTLFVGDQFDKGKGEKFVHFGIFLISISIIGRGLWADSITEVIISDIIISAGYILYNPIFSASFYNISKKSQHPLWFQYYAEMGWDVGAGSAALMTALLTFYGHSLQTAMMISILGFIVTNSVLKKYFKNI